MLKNKKIIALIILIVLICGYAVFALVKMAPTLNAKINIASLSEITSAKVVWPAKGQTALGAKGYGVVATNGEQKSAPIASIAKTMLALSVLEKYPLNTGEQGPNISFTQADIDKYNNYLKQNQSVVPIALDETLTEYQSLQALMLPSGNNIADALASWAFGSVDNYLAIANKKATDWGLSQTHFADASGFSPQTVSSARDLVVLGEYVLNNPVLADIVNQSEVDLPVAGKVYNVNSLLGQDNIVGIKTGNTDEAGGCFLFATKNNINGKDVTVISAILGDTDLATVLADSQTFIQNNIKNLQISTIVTKDQSVATVTVPWGKQVNIISQDEVNILAADNQKVTSEIKFDLIKAPMSSGQKVGEMIIKSGDNTKIIPLILSEDIKKPSSIWKLTHPFAK